MADEPLLIIFEKHYTNYGKDEKQKIKIDTD
jgi:hypothetical protein